MKIITTLFSFAIFLVSLLFALDNFQRVSVSLWPFDLALDAPLYILVLGALTVGLLLGGLFIWLNYLPHRFVARRLGKDVVTLSNRILDLERELEQLRAKNSDNTPPLLVTSKWRFWERFS
jgi:lipopolysaccharide assembly protein A